MGPTAEVLLLDARVWPHRNGANTGMESAAVAVAHGKILAIGPRREIEPLADRNTMRIDVGGRRVIPGLVDSHIHAVRAGLTYLDELDWTSIRSMPAALASVRRAAAERAPGTWITVAGGWHPVQLAENRMPSRAELDEAAPEHPVFVHPLYGHEDVAVVNTAALHALGWTGDRADPPDTVLYRDASGHPDGRFVGLSMYQRILGTAMRPTPARAGASTKAFFQRLASLGVTGVVDAAGLGMDPSKYDTVRGLWRAGELPVRVRMNVGAVTRGSESTEIAAWQRYLAPDLGDDMLSVSGMGEVVHFGCHDWEGMVPLHIGDSEHDELVETLRLLARAGWTLTIHAILDTSVSGILDAMETVRTEVSLAPLRWSLCHVECISERNLRRVRDLGLGLTLQSRMLHKSRICAQRWGAEALHRAPPLGDVLELGIPFGAGTDATRSASYNPWQALWWFVTGQCVDQGPRRSSRHRLDRETALSAYTRGSTWFTFEEDRRGILTPDADADLAVLSQDYFAVTEDSIPEITSELTIVAGRVVHAGNDFAGVPIQRHPGRPSGRARRESTIEEASQ